MLLEYCNSSYRVVQFFGSLAKKVVMKGRVVIEQQWPLGSNGIHQCSSAAPRAARQSRVTDERSVGGSKTRSAASLHAGPAAWSDLFSVGLLRACWIECTEWTARGFVRCVRCMMQGRTDDVPNQIF
jgi:hypothetical protein